MSNQKMQHVRSANEHLQRVKLCIKASAMSHILNQIATTCESLIRNFTRCQCSNQKLQKVAFLQAKNLQRVRICKQNFTAISNFLINFLQSLRIRFKASTRSEFLNQKKTTCQIWNQIFPKCQILKQTFISCQILDQDAYNVANIRAKTRGCQILNRNISKNQMSIKKITMCQIFNLNLTHCLILNQLFKKCHISNQKIYNVSDFKSLFLQFFRNC